MGTRCQADILAQAREIADRKRDPVSDRRSNRCEEPGCGRITREMKPCCIDHVGYLLQASRALLGLERYEKAVAAASTHNGPFTIDDEVLADIILVLREVGGKGTVEGMARQANLPQAVVARYARRLKWKFTRGRRGSLIIHLPGSDR